ncbi:MAG: ABC transporter permease [Anaerolineales bacterium]|nr:MAG: ABC transporter permease [Anaerolineales bacterium]
MGVLRYKIWSDLWDNKGRTLQVVAIIAMGAFAIGLIIGTRNLLIPAMEELWRGATPAMIVLWADPPVDENTLMVLERIEGVEGVEGYLTRSIEWKLHPEDQWKPAGLTARDDYGEQHYAKIELLSGHWPKAKVLAMGQGCDVAFGIKEGGQVTIRVADREHIVEIGGSLYDQYASPPSFGGTASFYTTRDRYEDLTEERNFNRIMASAAEPVLSEAEGYDEAVLTGIADEMQDKLEKQDVESGGAAPAQGGPTRVSDPNKHFFQDFMDGIFFIMGVMSIVALILGLLLVYNTINAIVTQQINQIGIMKAIGASTGTIFFTYMSGIFVYGFLALLFAVPLGAIGAHGLNSWLLTQFNATPGPFTVSPPAVLAQVAIALLGPLLASLKPILSGARITVREAISTYGLSAESGFLDRLLAKFRFISRLVSLMVSNTFRNKERVFLTQITLVMSGVVFMMVMSASESVRYTFEAVLFSTLKFNISLSFEDPERVSKVEEMTLSYPGVKAVEMWTLAGPTIRPAGQEESEDDKSASVFGVPLPTSFYAPQMRAGRWLQPGDTHAVVLNEILADDVGVGLDDMVTLNHGLNGESDWLVVGLLFDPVAQNSAHVPRDVLQKEINSTNRANAVLIQTVRDDAETEAAIARSLREYYDQKKIGVNPQGTFLDQDTATQIVDSVLGQFGMFAALFGIMAAVIGAIGGVALSGVLTLNVLERRREIGVMRAIGALSGVIAGLFVGEGLILGWLSWLIALPFSIPAGQLMTGALGAMMGGMSLVYKYNPLGALYWFLIVSVLSVVASLLPARSATRISVRESLAYE